MSAPSAVATAAAIAGGLGLFLYGMRVMCESLRQVASEKLRRILNLLTRRTVLAVFDVGFVGWQPSSALTGFPKEYQRLVSALRPAGRQGRLPHRKQEGPSPCFRCFVAFC